MSGLAKARHQGSKGTRPSNSARPAAGEHRRLQGRAIARFLALVESGESRA